MTDHKRKLSEEFPLRFRQSEKETHPAKVDLFMQSEKEMHPAKVDFFKEDLSKNLDKEEWETFHTFAFKTLCLCKKHKLDIQPTISVPFTKQEHQGNMIGINWCRG